MHVEMCHCSAHHVKDSSLTVTPMTVESRFVEDLKKGEKESELLFGDVLNEIEESRSARIFSYTGNHEEGDTPNNHKH